MAEAGFELGQPSSRVHVLNCWTLLSIFNALIFMGSLMLPIL